MRSFSLFFIGVAFAEETCSDGTCSQDEATLLQMHGLRQKALQEITQHQQPDADGVLNRGTQCWHGNQCNGQGGECPSGYCGDGGVCCRANWGARNDQEAAECGQNGYGINGMHTCQPRLLNEGQQCWHTGQCNQQGGRCQNYCGARGVCCRANWAARNEKERQECGENGHGNNGMHQCHLPPIGLVNGDFEDGFTPQETANPHTMSGSGYEYTNIFPGWTAAGGTVMVASGNGPWGGIVASSGDFLLALQSASAEIKQTVHLIPGQTYTLTVNAAQRTNSPGGTNAALKVSVDGQELMNQVVTSTTMEAQVVAFTADGMTEIKIENDVASGDQTVFVDGITLEEGASCAGLYEAEDANMNGGQVDANHPGFTGSGFYNPVDNVDDSVEWTLSGCAPGANTLSFRYALSSGRRPTRVFVNDVEVNTAFDMPATGGWNNYGDVTLSVDLQPGQNTVKMQVGSSSAPNIDSLTVL